MIFFDNASTTEIDIEVLASAMPYLTNNFYNPSSLYAKGRETKEAIEQARKKVSKAIHCSPDEIFFLPTATEANNWAIQTLGNYSCGFDEAFCMSPIEHPSVRNAASEYCSSITIPVTKDGILDTHSEEYECFMQPRSRLKKSIAVMLVNNEIGTIQPIDKISDDCFRFHIPLFVDCVQGAGKIKINMQKWSGVKMATISGHKIHSMRGAAILFVRRDFQSYLSPFNYGGGQEHNYYSGTENTPAIVALGTAMEKFVETPMDSTNIKEMKDYLIREISGIHGTRFNGKYEYQIPHILNVSFQGIEAESLLLLLDTEGIMVSSGSACHSGSLQPSYVLKSIGVEEDFIHGSIRISLSHENTMDECEKFLRVIKEEVTKLRSVSPTWKGE